MSLDNIKYFPVFNKVNLKDKKVCFDCYINEKRFSYFMGFGHVKEYRKLTKDNRICLNGSFPDLRILNKKYTSLSKVGIEKPKLVDVLWCLFLDSEAHDYSFPAWCREFGYNEDSIKDKQTYDLCSQTYWDLQIALGTNYHTIKDYIDSLNY